MSLISGKALWSVVCGTTILPSDEVVGEELEVAASHLADGLLFYQPYTKEDHDKWLGKVKLKDNQKVFVERLAKMLNLSSSQCWSLFQLYLQQEYRGSSSELMSALSSYRTESRLLHHIYTFYLTDPMHMLSCRMHLLAAATKPNHPYQKLFAVYLRDVLDPNKSLGQSMVSELQHVHDCIARHRDRNDQHSFFTMEEEASKPSKPSALDFATGNADLPDNAEYQWLGARLALAKHLLATLFLYYAAPNRPCPPEAIHTLISMAQGGGVCGGVVVESGQAAINTLLQDIDALHSLLLTLVINAEADTKSHVLCEAGWRDKLDPVFSTLGSRPGHLPPLLAWSVLQGRHTITDGSASNSGSVTSSLQGGAGGPAAVQHYSRMAERAVRGGVMAYLQSALQNQAILTDSLLLELSYSVVYALVCVAGSHLNLESGGGSATLTPAHLAVTCLGCSLPASLFWAEEGGGAGLLLPDALSLFPHRPAPLLALCTALAKASPDSCSKVVELLSELPSLTWLMSYSMVSSSCTEVGGDQVITHSTLHLLDGITLPPHTSGTRLAVPPQGGCGDEGGQFLVQWHLPTNAWQLMLGALHALDLEISSGVAVSDWLVELVEESLQLLCNVVRGQPSQLHSLTHIIQQSLTLTVRLSNVQEPRYSLLRWLLCLASEVSQHRAAAQRVWDKLAKCSLLPALPSQAHARTKGESVVQYYRSGLLRSIVCGEEATRGSYPSLRAFCSMLCAALRAGLSNSSIRGGVVFVVREVVPSVIVQWRYNTAKEKVGVLEAVMEVLHHSLEHGKADEDIAAEVSRQLSGRCGGNTLRSVLEAGATLEASLDAPPAQWPHATHATALARTAHLTLSILHRLVLVYCTGGDSNSPEKQRLRDLLAGQQRRNNNTTALLPLVGQGPQHLSLTVAQYVHHRLNSRLPYLALRTLTKLAQELGVPLVACLGSEAEVIRELLLNRLDAATEDTRVKVSITRLLTAAVSSQPGLLRAFLSPPDSLMDTLTAQLDTHSKSSEVSSVELVSSIVELVAALWSAGHAAAITTLRTNTTFWTVLARPLLQQQPEDADLSVLHHTVRLLALEHFVATKDHQSKLAAGLGPAMDTFMKSNFTAVTEYILGACSHGQLSSERLQLVRDWRDLMGVLLPAYTDTFTDQHLHCLCSSVLSALTACFSCPEQPSLRQAAHLLADCFLALNRHTGQQVLQWDSYWSRVGRVVEGLRAGLLQTPAPTQLRLLTALLLALQQLPPRDQKTAEHTSSIVDGVRIIVEQHCSLAGSATDNTTTPGSQFCSNTAVLQVACSVLHLCLLRQSQHTIDSLLQQSHVVSALVHAATILMQNVGASSSWSSLTSSNSSSSGGSVASSSPQCGSEGAVSSIVRLLSLLARSQAAGPDLSTQGLATSLALTLANTHQSGQCSSLSEVVWCAMSSVSREGVPGVDGCVAIAAVHLNSLVSALSAPQHAPRLAYSAAALTATLAPHYRLWIALHPHSYRLLVEATAACLHLTTHLVRLQGVLEREMSGKTKTTTATTTTTSSSGDTNDKSKDSLAPAQVVLIDKLLQVLLSCLRAVRLLGPELVELVCRPGVDVQEWLPALLQPSLRRASAPEHAQPNLGTLTALLDVCTTHLLKDKSGSSKKGSSSSTSSSGLSRSLLTACGEEALLLLLTQATLSLMSPDTSAREARDLRTWLQDDLNTFFNQWLGRRPSSLASPLPSTSGPHSPSSGGMDKRFLLLMQHLGNTITQTTTSYS